MPRDSESSGKDRPAIVMSGRSKESTSRPNSTSSSSAKDNSRDDSNRRSLKIVTKSPSERTIEMRTSLKEGASLNKKELYESVCEWENNEAKKLNIETHLKRNLNTCSELETLFTEIYELKVAGKTKTDEYAQKRTRGLMLLTKLRQMNRLFKLRLKNEKEEILEQRQEVDSDHLLLQNLLYEATHLNNQVLALQDYKGMDEKIELIPLEQFYEEAPPNISKPAITKEDPYQLRIARLEFEFVQRQKLTEQVKDLEKAKTVMTEQIDQQQANLSSIRPLLNQILEATKPAQKFFKIDLSDRKVMYNLAKYLPTPLYILYSSSTGYENSTPARKERFHASVGGDMEAAKELQQQIPQKFQEKDDSDSDDNMDVDEEGQIEESDIRKLRKRSSVFESKEDPKQKLIQKHPLWIEWEIRNELCGDRITLQFFYLTRLGIITVKSKLEISDESGKLSEVNLQSDNILCELFPNDLGLESPNPSTLFMLEKIDVDNFSEFIDKVGRPYFWAQKLSGLNFLTDAISGPVRGHSANWQPKATATFSNTFKIIRKRLINQSKLWRQLKMIESRTIVIPSEAKDLFPNKNSSLFTSWEPINWISYKAASFTQGMIDWEHSTETNLYFKAEFERGRAKMTALVTISLNFPYCPPLFCLQLLQGAEERSSENDSTIRDIEKELNVYAPEEFNKWGDTLLSFQLQRLIYCMDILLETDSSVKDSAGPSEFGREKLLMIPCRGKNYRRPFKYVPAGGGYFLHRY